MKIYLQHRGLEVQSHHRSQKSHSKSPEEEIFQKLKRLSKDSHGVHLGTGIDEKQPACVSGTSTTSSSEKKSFGCTVKGSSAIVLTPDSIVYNDNGIWSHRYDSSKWSLTFNPNFYVVFVFQNGKYFIINSWDDTKNMKKLTIDAEMKS